MGGWIVDCGWVGGLLIVGGWIVDCGWVGGWVVEGMRSYILDPQTSSTNKVSPCNMSTVVK